MKLVIINYGSGNLHSVNKSFEAANQNLQEPYDIQITNDPEVVKNADKIVLPGVGAFADCKKSIFDIWCSNGSSFYCCLCIDSISYN